MPWWCWALIGVGGLVLLVFAGAVAFTVIVGMAAGNSEDDE